MRIDLSSYDLDPAAVATTVRAADGPFELEPTAAHEHVGCITPEMEFDRRAAMAAAARTRDVTTTVDDALASAREERRELEPIDPETTDARRRVAEAAAELDELREEVAAKRGRLNAHREHGDGNKAEAEYLDAVRSLSEAETEYAAAVEQLEEAEAAARKARDERERQLQLVDRIDNLERTAREERVDAIRPAVEDAVRAAPGDSTELATADGPTAAMALARVSELRAPVVLSCRRFSDVETAGAWLDASVIRL